jgi:type I restriction enzyme S subunit
LPICYPPLSEQKAIAEVLECWDKGIRTLENKIGKKRLIKKGLMQRLLSGTLRLPGFSKGWKTIRLGDLGEFKTSSVDKKNEPDQEEAYLVNYMDVYRHRFITKKINFQKITATPTEIEKSQIQKGDILFTPSSETPDDIGHSAVVTEDLPKVLQSYHVVRLRIKNDDDLDFNFRGYVFNNADILNTFAHLSTGATRYTLSLGDFKNTQAYIPSDPKEQRAIAEVLAAADGEIEALERKLALWKDQKKFLLNNLVTGTIRLPEFC